MKYLIITTICFLTIISCKDPQNTKNPNNKPAKTTKASVKVDFAADSAYYFVEKQVSFGPRVPGTESHKNAADWMLSQMQKFADTAFFQIGTTTKIDGEVLIVKNIIARYNVKASYRTVLAAHWDTRPQADEDPDHPNKPADGANDGASGVGVLMELARQLSLKHPKKGIDIVFFDQEDGGEREGSQYTWCIGSQFWGSEAKKNNYKANQGILLDMVGSADAVFGYEKNSMDFNPSLVRKVWKTGQKLGYGSYFSNVNGGRITDDHIYMNDFANIPSIDIIHYDTYSPTRFPSHWHTLKDNMSIIDKFTLKAVGHTVLQTIMETDQK